MCFQFQSTLPQGERRYSVNALYIFRYFNPRSRKGSDALAAQAAATWIAFQSTLPQGERLPGIFVLPSANLFQSTLPQGERPGYSGMRSDGKSRFQSTLPQGERLTEALTGYTVYGFQSTLPQGERPLEPSTLVRYQIISIHAPARGATLLPVWPSGKTSISIHAPARGATQPGLQPVHW